MIMNSNCKQRLILGNSQLTSKWLSLEDYRPQKAPATFPFDFIKPQMIKLFCGKSNVDKPQQ